MTCMEFEINGTRRLYLAAGATEVWVCDREGHLWFFDAAGPRKRSRLSPKFPLRVRL